MQATAQPTGKPRWASISSGRSVLSLISAKRHLRQLKARGPKKFTQASLHEQGAIVARGSGMPPASSRLPPPTELQQLFAGSGWECGFQVWRLTWYTILSVYPSTHLCDVCRCMHIPTHVWIFWGVCKANGLYAHKPWQFHDVSALRGFENSVLSSPIIRKHIVP